MLDVDERKLKKFHIISSANCSYWALFCCCCKNYSQSKISTQFLRLPNAYAADEWDVASGGML